MRTRDTRYLSAGWLLSLSVPPCHLRASLSYTVSYAISRYLSEYRDLHACRIRACNQISTEARTMVFPYFDLSRTLSCIFPFNLAFAETRTSKKRNCYPMESITCWIPLNRHSDLPWNMDRGQLQNFMLTKRARHPWHEFNRSTIFLFQFFNALSAVDVRRWKYAKSLPIV